MWKSVKRFFMQVPIVMRYGIVLAAGLILLKTLEYQLFSYRFSMELYTGLLAGFFMLVGLSVGLGWLNFREKAQENPKPASGPVDPLTVKEHKLLKGLSEGLTNQQLADIHYLSVNTIKTHLKSVYRKLDVSNRTQAVARAKEWSLI